MLGPKDGGFGGYIDRMWPGFGRIGAILTDLSRLVRAKGPCYSSLSFQSYRMISVVSTISTDPWRRRVASWSEYRPTSGAHLEHPPGAAKPKSSPFGDGAPPLSQPPTPHEEMQALRLGRTGTMNFSPTRRAAMICGRPVVAPPGSVAGVWGAARGPRGAGQ